MTLRYKVALIGVFALGVLYTESAYREREKYRKTNEWIHMNLECIDRSAKRLQTLVALGASREVLYQAMSEESIFLEAVRFESRP